MFKPSQPATEPDLFTQTDHLLSGQAASQYSDPNAWHNQFHKHIKTRIDESIYNVLFDQRAGAPNAPVSVLVSMMILKEFFGWSDQQLFEHCRFHILVRKALGMTNMHDPLPVESTYYLLRKRMYEYNRSHGQDLMEQTFRSITAEQMRTFEVHGRQLRMDSKLFGSNIAWYSRYELIHRTLLAFCKDLDQGELSGFTREQRGQLTAFSQEQPAKVVYNESKTQLTNRLHQMGVLIYKLLHSCGDRRDQDDWKLLKRVYFDEKAVRAGIVRKQIKERLPEQRHVRNNVEATLYHLFCKMSGGKSRYRGLARQVTMVLCRAIGVNLHRIMKYEATGDSESLEVAGNNLYFRLYHWPKTVLLEIIAQTRSIIGLLQTQSLKLEIE